MSSLFSNFLKNRNQEIKTQNQKMKRVVDSYTFLDISQNIKELDQNPEISENIKESNIIIIGYYEERRIFKKYHYFVLGFKKTVLILNTAQTEILQSLLSTKEKLEIYFLPNTKEIFEETKIKYYEIQYDEIFQGEINVINSKFFNTYSKNAQFNYFLKVIKSCISGYLIKQSYYIYDKISNFNDSLKPREITEDEIIELRIIGIGCIFQVVLCYHIEYEKLVVIKKNYTYDSEI